MGRKTDYEKVREQDRRDKISITRCLKQLSEIEKELKKNSDEMNVPALRLRADISLNLLKKRMPDLKAMELIGELTHRFPDRVGVVGFVGDDNGSDPQDST